MASVSGVSSSKSIYGNRNVLSGLASGLDTESMIENAISAYKNKITALQQKRTKTEWKQEAYRSIIDKMSVFSDKYTSYNSASNLMSSSFFNQAVTTVAKGANASKVSAAGRTSSSVSLNGVKQLATSARYAISGSSIDKLISSSAAGKTTSALAPGSFDLDQPLDVSTFSGNMTLAYGGSDARTYLTVTFDETMIFKDDPADMEGGKTAAQKLVDEINNQLKKQTVTIGNSSYTGDELLDKVVKAEAGPNGTIGFTDSKKNGVYISSASESIQKVLMCGTKPGTGVKSLSGIFMYGSESLVKQEKSATDYLSETSMSITLDGVTKSFKMPTRDEMLKSLDDMAAEGKNIPYLKELKEKIANGEELKSAASRQWRDEAYVKALQTKIDDAFGKDKLTVSDAAKASDGKEGIQFQFTAKEGSTFEIKADKNKILGLGDSGTNSYLDTSRTIKDLLGEEGLKGLVSKEQEKKDSKGNVLRDEDGNPIMETVYSLDVNGVHVGDFTEDTSLSTLITQINNNKDAGVSASYSKTTNELVFTAKKTGAAEGIKFEGLSAALFGDPSADGADYVAGTDAVFSATINGKEMELTRASNTVELDGMSVTLKDTFGYQADGSLDPAAEKVTFETSSDSDKIVDAVKAMVEDYNAMVTELKNAYSTLPLQRSNKQYYEPLTDEDMEDMSESSIKAWEDKAKTGILFGDNDLATLYKRLTSAISMVGQDGADLKAAGITTSYADGLTTLKLDEKKLRETLESDPDRVRDIFSKSTETGASSNGLMQAIKAPLDLYGKTSGGKGILVDKAGSVLAPSTLYTNTIQKELNRIDEQIEKWEDKMSDQVDYYTNQFTRLEQLVQQMNSQSSYFSQLMMGG